MRSDLLVLPAIFGLTLALSVQTAASSTQFTNISGLNLQTQVDPATTQRDAQSFEGTITRSGDKLVLRENASQTAYQLDDQDKAKKFEGKDVKVMATVDAGKMLHVVTIEAIVTD